MGCQLLVDGLEKTAVLVANGHEKTEVLVVDGRARTRGLARDGHVQPDRSGGWSSMLARFAAPTPTQTS